MSRSVKSISVKINLDAIIYSGKIIMRNKIAKTCTTVEYQRILKIERCVLLFSFFDCRLDCILCFKGFGNSRGGSNRHGRRSDSEALAHRGAAQNEIGQERNHAARRPVECQCLRVMSIAVTSNTNAYCRKRVDIRKRHHAKTAKDILHGATHFLLRSIDASLHK